MTVTTSLSLDMSIDCNTPHDFMISCSVQPLSARKKFRCGVAAASILTPDHKADPQMWHEAGSDQQKTSMAD